MKENESQNRRTVFRRIGGRIVPITIGGGLIHAGRKLDVEKHGIKINQFAMKTLDKQTLGAHTPNFSNIHSTNVQTAWNKYFKREGLKTDILRRVYDDKLTKFRTTVQYDPTRGSHFSANGIVSPYITLKSGDHATFLHELGHAEQYKTGFWGPKERLQNLRSRVDRTIKEKLFKPYVARARTKAGDSFYAVGSEKFKRMHPKLEKFSKIIQGSQSRMHGLGLGIDKKVREVDAWRRAFKYAKTRKVKAQIVKRSIPALGSYFAKDIVKLGKYGLIGLGASAIGYGLFHRQK